MKNKLSETLAQVLDDYGFNVEEMEDSCEISIYTPAGEDWCFYMLSDGDFENFVEDFDPDEEFDMLYKSGCRGLPKPSELIEDQLWKQKTLNNVLDDYYERKRENETIHNN